MDLISLSNSFKNYAKQYVVYLLNITTAVSNTVESSPFTEFSFTDVNKSWE